MQMQMQVQVARIVVLVQPYGGQLDSHLESQISHFLSPIIPLCSIPGQWISPVPIPLTGCCTVKRR